MADAEPQTPDAEAAAEAAAAPEHRTEAPAAPEAAS